MSAIDQEHLAQGRAINRAAAELPTGAYLRPIGLMRYSYTMRVLAHFGADSHGAAGIEYERWGLRCGRPIDDGHIGGRAFVEIEPTLLPGIWRAPQLGPNECWGGDRDEYRYSAPSTQRTEIYYRLCPGPVREQIDMLQEDA